MAYEITRPKAVQADEIAALWHRAWHEGHHEIAPAALVALRDAQSFPARVRAEWDRMRVLVSDSSLAGLCICRGPEMYQLFVAQAFYGQGVAGLLLADAERRLADAGVRIAWLACAPGNARAVAFYKKAGWVPVGEVIEALDTAKGVFELPVIRFEKQVSPG